MNTQDLSLLIVKDALVRQHKFALLLWTRGEWERAVSWSLQAFKELPDRTQANRRMRYHK